ncbi:MAG: hypothetical protein GY847_15540 [Proteobacteria bacterium]|nr:hypothetical protein [Pseudomonadota bacterium]
MSFSESAWPAFQGRSASLTFGQRLAGEGAFSDPWFDDFDSESDPSKELCPAPDASLGSGDDPAQAATRAQAVQTREQPI